jgi:hypothetical protein
MDTQSQPRGGSAQILELRPKGQEFGVWVEGLGLRGYRMQFRVYGLGFKFEGSGLRVEGVGLRV